MCCGTSDQEYLVFEPGSDQEAKVSCLFPVFIWPFGSETESVF